MADRKFERQGKPHGDRMISVQMIRCGVEGCAEIFEVPDTGRIPLPPDAVSSKARRANWKVGRNASRDRCPAHAHNREIPDMNANGRAHGGAGRTIGEIYNEPIVKPAVPAGTRQVFDSHTVAKDGVVTMRDVPKGTVSIEIREMDRDDKRLIYGELDVAYVDAEHGYKPGNSDAAIAESLGVPVLWVRNVRDEMFGPADGSKATKKILELRARLDALDPQIIKAAESVSALMTLAQDIRLELNALQRKE